MMQLYFLYLGETMRGQIHLQNNLYFTALQMYVIDIFSRRTPTVDVRVDKRQAAVVKEFCNVSESCGFELTKG